MDMPRHPDTGPPPGRSDWTPDAMLLCWIVGVLVILGQAMNSLHVLSLVHESAEGCYSGTSPHIRHVPTEHYSGSDFSLIPPHLTCYYGGEGYGTPVTSVDLTPWSPLIFWVGTAVLCACVGCGLWLRRVHRRWQAP
jgi:hypothetical protein